jgi:hypothetical protein
MPNTPWLGRIHLSVVGSFFPWDPMSGLNGLFLVDFCFSWEGFVAFLYASLWEFIKWYDDNDHVASASCSKFVLGISDKLLRTLAVVCGAHVNSTSSIFRRIWVNGSVLS